MQQRPMIFLSALTIFLLLILHNAQSCNEAVCGSIVSKCLLTQSCKCDFKKDCTCCKECSICLSILYDECCSCVGMCPQPNDTAGSLSQQSHVEDFPTDAPALFDALKNDANEKRWSYYSFPVDLPLAYVPKNDIKYQMQSAEQEVMNNKINITSAHNCTVAFISKCLSWEKCKSHCQSMGASSMRWFHDGCCECVGTYCINYGIKESRCEQCSKKNEAMTNSLEDEFDDDDLDYGGDFDSSET